MKNDFTRVLAIPLLLAAASGPAFAQSNPTFTLTGSEVNPNAYFGWSVGLSGATAIVGARNHDQPSMGGAGAAYLFDVTTGSELFILTASDPAGGDEFGGDVAISGTTAIAGARLNDDAGINSGSAYLFDTATGTELFKLVASDAAMTNFFGSSVAIEGTTALVTAPGNDSAAVDAGAAYLFDTTTGLQTRKIVAADAAAYDGFGYSAAISGTKAIVGAYTDDDGGSNSGSAYIFDTTTGSQLVKLTASDAAADDFFGRSVDIEGNIAIVSAYGDDDGGDFSGSVYLFDATTGSQLSKLTVVPAPSPAVRLGEKSVRISGRTAIVSGTYLFDINTGNQIGKVGTNSLSDVDIEGSTAIVGTYRGNTASLFDLGYQASEPTHGTVELNVLANSDTSLTDALELTNTGEILQQLAINGYLITGPDAGLFSVPDFVNVVLDTRGTDTVLYDLYFSGEAVGQYEATVTFFTPHGNFEYGLLANVTPEPGSLALLGLGGTLITRRRRA